MQQQQWAVSLAAFLRALLSSGASCHCNARYSITFWDPQGQPEVWEVDTYHAEGAFVWFTDPASGKQVCVSGNVKVVEK